MKLHPLNINLFSKDYRSIQSSAKNNITGDVSSANILNYMHITGGYNLSFCAARKPLYSIDNEGNYNKHLSLKEAGRTVGADAASIGACLSGKRCTAGGYMFVSADEIETVDKNGNVTVDEKKLNDKIFAIRELKAKDPNEVNKRPIYSIDRDGNYQKYMSVSAVARALGGSGTNIVKCLKGNQKTSCGVGFMYADDLERVGTNGKISINKWKLNAKVKELSAVFDSQPKIRPFYSVDEEGKYIKFEQRSEAGNVLGIDTTHINQCLNKERSTTAGYAFFYADEVEYIDEQGKISVNFEMADDLFGKRTPVPLYAIGQNGKVVKFMSMGEAAKKLSVPRRNIDACLKGERDSAGGFAYIKAEELEVGDWLGKTLLDTKKIDGKFKQVIKNAIYVIDADGKYVRYDNAQKAADALNVSQGDVLFCVNGVIRGINEKALVRAIYIDSIKDGKLIRNQDLINKFARQAEELVQLPIVAIDKNGKKRVFKNKKRAAIALGIDTSKITKCLNGSQKTTNGYEFKYQDKRPRSKIVYALDAYGNLREFKDIDQASSILGIDKSDIEFYLKKGVSKDKKKGINGYVFATGNDE